MIKISTLSFRRSVTTEESHQEIATSYRPRKDNIKKQYFVIQNVMECSEESHHEIATSYRPRKDKMKK